VTGIQAPEPLARAVALSDESNDRSAPESEQFCKDSLVHHRRLEVIAIQASDLPLSDRKTLRAVVYPCA
jgi:hypothetical protein